MFDTSKQLIMCNQSYRDLYSIPDELAVPGTHLKAMLEHRVSLGNYEGQDTEAYVARLMKLVEDKNPIVRKTELADGRIVRIKQQPVHGIGWISMHEDVTEHARAEALVAHLARHDALTGLPNRVALEERISSALGRESEGENAAVLSIDLDRFKHVNDTLGHPAGDALLKAVAERLRNAVRERDTVARFGGDEFAIVQVGPSQPQAARALARRVVESLSMPYKIDGHDISIGASVGIAFAPAHGSSPDELLKFADVALYRAKERGRGHEQCFEPNMHAALQDRRHLELDLRSALASDQLILHYQPIVDVATGEVICCEALLRWPHPTRGMTPPAEFIPLAEQVGLISALGEWVLHKACAEAAAWPANINVAVNVSPTQFGDAKIVSSVERVLAASGLASHRLELEITEDVLLSANESNLAVLRRLRSQGVRIVMDDFGSGYSSLSYLNSFAMDKIKLDGSFVDQMASDHTCAAIVRAIIGLCKELHITTVAERVDCPQQLAMLLAEACGQVQGFLLARPMPASELKDLWGKNFKLPALSSASAEPACAA
jgi:diguanylate cyclase (GGDEF)-like protein